MNLGFFRICKKVSNYSDHHQHKIGVVIVKGNKILSTGFNKLKTHPLSPHPFKSCHAEFMAIKLLSSENLKGSSIYIFRQTKLGKLALAKPCASCRDLISNSGIKKLYYTTDLGVKYERI